MGSPLRTCTFNIRLDTASDGPDNWHRRRAIVRRVLNSIDADVVCLQEPMPHQFEWLVELLGTYDWYGVPRRGHKAGERAVLGWRSDRFDAVECTTRWLSETPRLPSTGWDADIPRVATGVRLLDWNRDGEPIAVWGTHFDHRGEIAQTESAGLLASWCQTDVPSILLGDFNVTMDSAPMQQLVTDAAVRDARSAADNTVGPRGTFHGFVGEPRQPIDHVLVTAEIAVERVETVTTHVDGRYPSDHFPVVADLAV